MIGTQFYHETIRTAVSVFGSLFNNLVIKRRDGKVVPVPIAYGPRVKWLDAQNQLSQNNEAFENLLPRMSYELVSMEYDTNRKLNTKQNVTAISPLLGGRGPRINAPVPYSLGFKLYLQTKNLNDGWQIIEQILPFFQPAYTVRVRNFPDTPQFGRNPLDSNMLQPLNEYDMPITLESVTWEDEYEGDLQTRRDVQWELTFETKVHMWGPVIPATIIYDARAAIGAVTANDQIYQDIATLGTISEAGFYNQTNYDRQSIVVEYPYAYWADSENTFIINDLLSPPDSDGVRDALPPQAVRCRYGALSPCPAYLTVYNTPTTPDPNNTSISRDYFISLTFTDDQSTAVVEFYKFDPTYAATPRVLPPIVDISDSEGGIIRVTRPVLV